MKSGSKGVTGNLLNSFKFRIKKKNKGVLTGFKGGKGGGNHSWLIDDMHCYILPCHNLYTR